MIEIKLRQVAQMDGFESTGRIYSPDGLCPTINTCGGGNREVKIAVPQLVGGVGEINFGTQYRQGNRIYDSEGIAMALMSQPIGNAGGNSYLCAVEQKDNLVVEPSFVVDPKLIEFAINKSDGECYGTYLNQIGEGRYRKQLLNESRTIKADTHAPGVINNFRVRKLTPKEYFRLVDFTDEDFEKARANLIKTFYKGKDKASSQLYKQAGNSIVVAVPQAIFGEML